MSSVVATAKRSAALPNTLTAYSESVEKLWVSRAGRLGDFLGFHFAPLFRRCRTTLEKIMQPNERIALSQWLLDKQLGWIASAEAKIGFTVAIDTAILTGLAAAWTQAGASHGDMQIVASTLCAIFTGCSLVATALASKSRVTGPGASLVFFGRVSELPAQTYCQVLSTATEQVVLDDLALQIHRNAEIARDKHWWAWRSAQFGFLGGLFLIIAAALLLH